MQRIIHRVFISALILLFAYSGVLAQYGQSGLAASVSPIPQDQPLKATVDTLCGSWHICLRDTSGIKFALLLDDLAGKLVKPPRKFRNATFDPLLDSTNVGEIVFSGKDTAVCFDVYPVNPLDSSYAPLYISDIKGDVIVIDLYYASQRIRRAVLPDLSKRADSITFPITGVGDEVCSTLVYINTTASGAKDFSVNAVSLKRNSGDFTISSVIPAVPSVMKPGDSLKIQVCYNPKKIGNSRDSVIVASDCYPSSTLIKGVGVNPSMLAGDIAFPQVEVDSVKGGSLTIINDGSLAYSLTKSWKLSDTVNFSIDPVSAAQFPVSVNPSNSKTFKIYFHPRSIRKDTARIDWATDIDSKYSFIGKKYSLLIGEGIPDKINDVNTDISGLHSLTIRPNPVSGNFATCVFSSSFSLLHSTISIFDVLGREVMVQGILPGTMEIELPVWNLVNGIYYVRFSDGTSAITQQLEVLR